MYLTEQDVEYLAIHTSNKWLGVALCSTEELPIGSLKDGFTLSAEETLKWIIKDKSVTAEQAGEAAASASKYFEEAKANKRFTDVTLQRINARTVLTIELEKLAVQPETYE